MSCVVFFSAKGAPGASTTAMLVAALWPRPALLADCDPAGGDIGLRLPAPDGRPLDLSRGMLSLLPAARRSLDPRVLLEHSQQVLGGGEVLVGMSGPEQAAAAVAPLWSTLAGAFGALTSHDAIIDVGRLDSRSPVLPLAAEAQLAVCVVQGSLSGVFASRARLRTLLPVLVRGDGSGPRLGVLVQSGDRRDAEGAGSVIQSEFPTVAYLGHLATDPTGARIFDGQPVSRPERTMLVRSGREVVATLHSELSRTRLSREQIAQQPWNAFTGAYASYAPYLSRAAGAPPAEPGPPQPANHSEGRRARRFTRGHRNPGGGDRR